jgi:putative nucleotidyltransferase with HDIG domain
MNEMYLATIEALALAVDAKDQITHGHIRRVQICTVELAKQLGVTDEGQLQAIEAAALLHDMGKLAVPEYILNKPGKLSAVEFDKMKTHAEIGADLLSSVKFPYPVVPIVRHHHENWNGSGYPTGLSGVDIPLGARLLSVVDCFDALTSDRPYRPRLTNEAAFAILRERRGSFYDPLVVDTFIANYDHIAARIAQEDSAQQPGLLSDFTDSPAADQRQDGTSGSPQPPVELLEVHLQRVSSADTLQQAFALAARCVTHLTPTAVCGFYEFDADSGQLVCTHAGGRDSDRLLNLAIDMGERVTGWAAANDTTSLNSHAALDLGPLAQDFVPALQSSLSVPIKINERLVGVVTCYSERPQAFSQAHCNLVTRLALTLAGSSQRQSAPVPLSSQVTAKL